MTAPAAPPEDAPHWARPLLEAQIAMLSELAEEGMAIARDIRAAGLDPAQTVMAYGRTARAVRLTLMLQQRLIKDLIAFDARVAQEAVWHDRDRTRERKAGVARIMERVIGRERHNPKEVDRLVWETSERLDREDLYGPLLARPVSELVAMIAQDLGLDPDWSRLAVEAWAKAEAAGEDVGWPLAGLRPDPDGPGQDPPTSDHPGEGRDPDSAAFDPDDPEPPHPKTWVPAFAGMSG